MADASIESERNRSRRIGEQILIQSVGGALGAFLVAGVLHLLRLDVVAWLRVQSGFMIAAIATTALSWPFLYLQYRFFARRAEREGCGLEALSQYKRGMKWWYAACAVFVLAISWFQALSTA